jgi:tetratricopeptide (TPR) repeat protein
MKKILLIILFVLTAVALLSPDESPAWVTVRTGQKNFERAWSAYMFRRTDSAMEYFTKAADAFGAGLLEEPPSRTTMFSSNLTMAGMSLYYAGRYQDAVPPFEKVIDKDDQVWEAPLYAGLCKARMNDRAGAVGFWTAYIKSNPSQSILSGVVVRQLANLETNTGSLDQAADAVEKAVFDQYDNNITLTGPMADNPQNLCSGNYWWRYNKSPCNSRRTLLQ